VVLLALTLLGCGGIPDTPVSSPGSSKAVPAPTTQAPSPEATVRPTDTPEPTVPPTVTPGLAAEDVCPPPGNPKWPARPESLEEYAQVLSDFLTLGADAGALEATLLDWGALAPTESPVLGGEQDPLQSLDLTGDGVPEILAIVVDPEAPFSPPPGDLLIFYCWEAAVVRAFSAMDVDGGAWLGYFLLEIRDLNGNGLPNVAYVSMTCGAHTCFHRLHIVEWDGVVFQNLIPDFEPLPYGTFEIGDGQVRAQAAGFASAGAGDQRSYHETWDWDGRIFALTDSHWGPPVVRVHFLYDGDDALMEGDYAAAIENYRAALLSTDMYTGLFLPQAGEITLEAFARFKLLVAYAVTGDDTSLEETYQSLSDAVIEAADAYVYLLMAQAFRAEILAGRGPGVACEAAVAVAADYPKAVDSLYAGYANTMYYEPEDLCRVP
jgi:hypothetical protein